MRLKTGDYANSPKYAYTFDFQLIWKAKKQISNSGSSVLESNS
jgi:hypothetical protein